jgi:hypothetical protein
MIGAVTLRTKAIFEPEVLLSVFLKESWIFVECVYEKKVLRSVTQIKE